MTYCKIPDSNLELSFRALQILGGRRAGRGLWPSDPGTDHPGGVFESSVKIKCLCFNNVGDITFVYFVAIYQCVLASPIPYTIL